MSPSYPRCAGLPVFVLGNFVQACCWSVPRLPLPGETLVASSLLVEPGGKGLNVTIGLQRMGAGVSTLMGIGRDPAGDGLLDLLHREGVDARHVSRFPGASGWGAGFIGADGQNAIAVYPGANLALTANEVQRASPSISESKLVYGQFETSLVAVAAAFELAHAAGVPTVLNPSPWQDDVPEAIRRCTGVVIVNEVEARGLLHLAQPLAEDAGQALRQVQAAEARFWREWPAAHGLVVTLGAQGCVALECADSVDSRCWMVPTYPVQAVDTVGAGDAFASGFCAAWLAGWPWPQALDWANASGAWMASRRGVLNHLPGAAELASWRQEQVSVPQPFKVSR